VALVKDIIPVQKERHSVHSEAECSSFIFMSDGQSYLQLDSYGSPGRERPGQISQSFQFDEEAARQLQKLIRKAFPRLK
jgi:hypothetical protein